MDTNIRIQLRVYLEGITDMVLATKIPLEIVEYLVHTQKANIYIGGHFFDHVTITNWNLYLRYVHQLLNKGNGKFSLELFLLKTKDEVDREVLNNLNRKLLKAYDLLEKIDKQRDWIYSTKEKAFKTMVYLKTPLELFSLIEEIVMIFMMHFLTRRTCFIQNISRWKSYSGW